MVTFMCLLSILSDRSRSVSMIVRKLLFVALHSWHLSGPSSALSSLSIERMRETATDGGMSPPPPPVLAPPLSDHDGGCGCPCLNDSKWCQSCDTLRYSSNNSKVNLSDPVRMVSGLCRVPGLAVNH
jgi:hypothetical protein